MKTNLKTFAVIWVKRRQKAGFLRPRSSKITLTKGKERRKGKSEEKERRRKKSNGCTLSFYNSKETVFAGKICWTRKGPFADKVFTHPARCTRLFFLLGAIACLKLKKFEEAVKWCDQGLSVSFYMNLPSRSWTHFSFMCSVYFHGNFSSLQLQRMASEILLLVATSLII